MIINSPVTIDGTEISGLIAFRGLSWSFRYVTGSNGGVTLAGYTQMDILAVKVDLDIECRAMRVDELQTLLAAITPKIVHVTYDDPLLGVVTKEMHPSAQAASFFNNVAPTGEPDSYVWENISFKLEEL